MVYACVRGQEVGGGGGGNVREGDSGRDGGNFTY